jgi:hypothetical protein
MPARVVADLAQVSRHAHRNARRECHAPTWRRAPDRDDRRHGALAELGSGLPVHRQLSAIDLVPGGPVRAYVNTTHDPRSLVRRHRGTSSTETPLYGVAPPGPASRGDGQQHPLRRDSVTGRVISCASGSGSTLSAGVRLSRGDYSGWARRSTPVDAPRHRPAPGVGRRDRTLQRR